MAQYKLKKSDFPKFINSILKSQDIIAPVKGDKTKLVSKSKFSSIKLSDEIYLKELPTYFPAKSFFFDKKEAIFNFNGDKIINPPLNIKPRVFFGLRRCDLNGIKHQDMVFLDEHTDPFYKKRRDNSLLIGLHCKEGDKYCFCNSVELKDYFDLMFYDKGSFYAIESGSVKGEKFTKKYSSLIKPAKEVITANDRRIKNKNKLTTTEIAGLYSRREWEKLSELCLSCGACNHLCPNCHCFEIKDEVNIDLKTGTRFRIPSACQSKGFTRVAGDHIFRETRVSRFKHRIYHQIQYFKERHDEIFCTGCGRCIRGCPTRIDWVTTINKMSGG